VASSRVQRNSEGLKQSLSHEKDNYIPDYRCAFPFVLKQLEGRTGEPRKERLDGRYGA